MRRPNEGRKFHHEALLNPSDYVAFNGLFEKNDIDSISFVELKSGESSLTTIQRRIRDAVNDGRVEWKVYNVTDIVEKKLNKPKGESYVLKGFS